MTLDSFYGQSEIARRTRSHIFRKVIGREPFAREIRWTAWRAAMIEKLEFTKLSFTECTAVVDTELFAAIVRICPELV